MQQPRDWILLPENRAARQAVERVRRCLSSGMARRESNPLTLHGPPGCGKTRLSEDLAAAVSRDGAGRVVRSLPASDFSTLEDPSPPGPLSHTGQRRGQRELLQADLLIVEDLQFLPARAVETFVQILDR